MHTCAHRLNQRGGHTFFQGLPDSFELLAHCWVFVGSYLTRPGSAQKAPNVGQCVKVCAFLGARLVSDGHPSSPRGFMRPLRIIYLQQQVFYSALVSSKVVNMVQCHNTRFHNTPSYVITVLLLLLLGIKYSFGPLHNYYFKIIMYYFDNKLFENQYLYCKTKKMHLYYPLLNVFLSFIS